MIRETAYPTLVWTMLQYRGDVDFVRFHYNHLKLYFEFFESKYKTEGLKSMSRIIY